MLAGLDEVNMSLGKEENADVNSEHSQDLLLAIKSVTEKIAFEITGGAAIYDEDRVGLAENNSLKQVQEEILYQMKTMNANIEAVSNKLEESLKIQERSLKLQEKSLAMQEESMKQEGKAFKELTKRCIESSVASVRFSTKLSWNTFLINEVAGMQINLGIPRNGRSLQGNTLAELAQLAPRPDTKEDIRELSASIQRRHFPPNSKHLWTPLSNLDSVLSTKTAKIIIERHLKERKPILLELCNHSDFLLHKPQMFLQSGSVLSDMSEVVLPGTREVTCFYTGIYDEGIQCLSLYEVETKDLRLTVKLDYLPSSAAQKFEVFCGLAFVPTYMPIVASMFTKELSKISSTEFNFDKENGNCKVICNRNLIAASTVTVEDNYIVLKIQLLKNIQQKPSDIPEMKSARDGYTSREKSSYWNALFGACVGCVAEIENGLNIRLEELQWHLDTASQFVLPCSIIPGFTREMFYVQSDISTKGIVSYKIENTDLRLAVVFWTKPASNRFAVGFISHDTLTNAATMNSLTTTECWKTRPHLFADAQEGEQVLEYRNFRVISSMTADSKAILKIIITAF